MSNIHLIVLHVSKLVRWLSGGRLRERAQDEPVGRKKENRKTKCEASGGSENRRQRYERVNILHIMGADVRDVQSI
jgi:hypothetical protein